MGFLRNMWATHNRNQAQRPDFCRFECQDASVRYEDGGIGLQPTSLTIDERRVAVIGFNGSGKTSLLRLLDGSMSANSGSVTIHGGAQSWNPASRRDRATIDDLIGRVRREELPGSFYRAPTVREALSRSMKHHHVPPAQSLTIIGTLLAQAELVPVANLPASALSSEQRHVLAMVSVLGYSPTAIIADEPTKGLDEVATAHVARILFGFGKQVIFATHDLSLLTNAQYGVQRALLLNDRHVMFDGEPAAAAERYEQLIAQRFEALRHGDATQANATQTNATQTNP